VTQPEHHRRRAGERTRAVSHTARISSPRMMQIRTKPHSPLMDLEEQLPLPKRSYVYAIHVDGVLRYIGKGTDDRMYAHMKEVSQRLTRKFKLKNVSPFFQRKLTEAVMKGAVIEQIVLADDLTSKQAYKLEYRHLERMVTRGIASNCGMLFRQASIRPRSTKPTYRNSPKTRRAKIVGPDLLLACNWSDSEDMI